MSVYQSYQIYEVIGHGASCTVKRAVRKDTRQTFAAKLCQSNFLSAKNQIQMLVRLDHPNIVNIYQVFEDEDCIIQILEYMEGGQLYDSVGQRSTFTESQVKVYMRILVDTIRYCHEMNVVHRDIKPQNLLLNSNNPEGILKLADFGISKILSDQVLTTNCGTPIYMAPQIWEGHSYDSKVDIWSLGIVMYYLLSGTHPFNGDLQDIGDKIISQKLTFDLAIWNLISSKAIDLIRKMLDKDPLKRPSAIEVTQHLWFSQIEVQSPISDVSTQISLQQSVHKIKRNVFKHKEKRAKRKLQHIYQADKKLSNVRMEFLVYSASETSASPASESFQMMEMQ